MSSIGEYLFTNAYHVFTTTDVRMGWEDHSAIVWRPVLPVSITLDITSLKTNYS